MGGLGSDAAIESADVVIQNDQPSKVATAITIGRKTRTIVRQNIIGALVVKGIVLSAGALGYATLWGQSLLMSVSLCWQSSTRSAY